MSLLSSYLRSARYATVPFPPIPYPLRLSPPQSHSFPPLSMATTSLNALHHPFLHRHHHSFTTSFDSPLFLRPNTTTQKLFSNLSTSPLTPTTTTSNSSPSLDALANHLLSSNFRQADEETRRLVITLAGEAAQKRGYVFFSEVQFISADDLRAIDELWRQHSGNKFGYSVQRRIWEKSARDFTRFFVRVGWMKRLDTEVEQYNYRAFPEEFMWELTAETPEGHLPLTNALRGTQLLASILTHRAFEESLEEVEEEGEDEEDKKSERKKGLEEGRERPKLLRSFKPDYSL